MKSYYNLPLVILSLFILAIPLNAQDKFGKIVYVSDGDTFHFLEKGRKDKIRVRLAEVDCPETTQDFGLEAKEFAHSKIFRKNVKLIVKEIDHYGRTVGHILYVDEGEHSLAEELLKRGYAWHYKRYSNSEYFAILEDNARKEKLGLFSKPNPIEPWEFRKIK